MPRNPYEEYANRRMATPPYPMAYNDPMMIPPPAGNFNLGVPNFNNGLPGHPTPDGLIWPTAGDTGYQPQLPTNPRREYAPYTPPPVSGDPYSMVAGVRAGGGPPSFPTPSFNMPGYSPEQRQIPEFGGLPPAQYLPQLLAGQSVQEAMPLPEMMPMMLPQLTGGQLLGFNPQMVENMAGFVQRVQQDRNNQAQQRFANQGTQINTARGLDSDQLQRDVAGVSARGTHVSTEQGILGYENYESPELQRQRGQEYSDYSRDRDFGYQQKLKEHDFEFSKALIDYKAAYDMEKAMLMLGKDEAIKRQFDIHETNVKNFLSGMDLDDVKSLFDTGGKMDISTLLANPSFKVLTNNQKQSIASSLQFFQKYGVDPSSLIGAASFDRLQGNPAQPRSPGMGDRDPLGLGF